MSRVLKVSTCLFVALCMFSGCDKTKDETIINDRTRLPEENSDLLSVLSRGDTLLLVYKTGAAQPAFVADDIVVGRSGDGYIKRVVSSSTRADTLVLATEQASLTDAIEKYATDTSFALSVESTKMQSVRVDTTCVGSDGSEYRVVIQSQGPTVNPIPSGNQFEVRLPNMSLEIHDGSELAAYISYDTVILQKGLDVDLGLRINKAELAEFKAIVRSSEGVRFRGGKLGFVKSIASIEKELELARVPLGTAIILTPTVPPVPIVFTFELGVYVGLGAGLSLDVSGEILNSASVSCTTTVGARYGNGAWQPVYECSPTASADFSFTPPAGSITAALRGFLKGSLETKVYGVAGPELYVKPYVYDKITIPPAKLEIGAGIAAGLGFEVEVLSKKLLGYDWTFADYEWVIAETTYGGGGNNPPNTPTTPTGPSSGQTGTSYDFTSSATDPDGDNVALRFDWGDGNTSDWSSYVSSGTPVTASHSWSSAGSFGVKSQAKDIHGAVSGWSSARTVTITGSGASFVYLGRNAQGYDEYLSLPDSAVMIEIPAGWFTMGSNDGYDDEKPVHEAYLDEYLVDKYPVTNRQYKRFCDRAGHGYPPDPGFSGMSNYFTNYPDYPVVNVSWDDAAAYCDWAGKRLLTEAEWEKAARGTDARKYPWGNSEPDGTRCNMASNPDGYDYTSPVGVFPAGASPYGALDMAGNVWDWCNDWYASDYYSQSPTHNPPGPSSGSARVLRGGSWIFGAWYVRCARRSGVEPSYRAGDLGFRCAGGR